MFPVGPLTTYSMADDILSTLTAEMLNQPTTIFTTLPLTVHYNCTWCEQTMDLNANPVKTEEMRQMEEAARDYFTQRVLRFGEEGVGGLHVGEETKRLLSTVRLCQPCVNEFARSERKVLMDQMKYLEKMKSCKKLEEVFLDPWLDIKRLAFTSLKGQEDMIQRKLDSINKCLTGDGASTSSSVIIVPDGGTAGVVTTAVAIPVSQSKLIQPLQGQLTTDITLIDVFNECLHRDEPNNSSNGGSKGSSKPSSSRVCSPKPGSIATESPASRRDESVDVDLQKEDEDTVSKSTKSTCNESGKTSELPGTSSSKQFPANIPPTPSPRSKCSNYNIREMSPVVRLKHVDLGKIRTPSRNSSRAGSEVQELLSHGQNMASDHTSEQMDSTILSMRANVGSQDYDSDSEGDLVIDTDSETQNTQASKSVLEDDEHEKASEQQIDTTSLESLADDEASQIENTEKSFKSTDTPVDSEKNLKSSSATEGEKESGNKSADSRKLKRKRKSSFELSSDKQVEGRNRIFEVKSSKQVKYASTSDLSQKSNLDDEPATSSKVTPFKVPTFNTGPSSNPNNKPSSKFQKAKADRMSEGVVYAKKSVPCPQSPIHSKFQELIKSNSNKWQPGSAKKNSPAGSKPSKVKSPKNAKAQGKSKEKKKFQIGNRFMTESESGSDSSDIDSDVEVPPDSD